MACKTIYFRLENKEMDTIIDEVKTGLSAWRSIATEIGIPRSEQSLMAAAFKI